MPVAAMPPARLKTKDIDVVSVTTCFEDAVLLILLVIALPLAILLVGAPLVMLVRLLVAIAQRLL